LCLNKDFQQFTPTLRRCDTQSKYSYWFGSSLDCRTHLQPLGQMTTWETNKNMNKNLIWMIRAKNCIQDEWVQHSSVAATAVAETDNRLIFWSTSGTRVLSGNYSNLKMQIIANDEFLLVVNRIYIALSDTVTIVGR